jgi:hypothetical protein
LSHVGGKKDHLTYHDRKHLSLSSFKKIMKSFVEVKPFHLLKEKIILFQRFPKYNTRSQNWRSKYFAENI